MRRKAGKEKVFCYAFFAVQLAAFLLILLFAIYRNSYPENILLHSAQAGFILLAASFLVSFFSKRFSLEKKIFVMLGTTAIFFGIVSMMDLVAEGRATFLDAIYKSIQLFVGEFEYASVYNQPIPPLLNVARFTALFVTFGTIFTIILKQKIYNLNIWLFYRDILIIADRNSDYASSLAGKFQKEGRKTVLAFLQQEESEKENINSNIPIVYINADTDIDLGIKTCNARNSKQIYLFCEKTSINVLIAKKIYALKAKGRKRLKGKDSVEKERVFDSMTSEGLLNKYYETDDTATPIHNAKKAKTHDSVICYIHYKKDSDRGYYSADEVFTNRQDGFETYFINVYDIAIRQMIANMDVAEIIEDEIEEPENLINALETIKIAVAGSGRILEHTIAEISKTFVFARKYPMEVYLLSPEKQTGETEPLNKDKLGDILNIRELSVQEFSGNPFKIHTLFIVSDDEKEVFDAFQNIFHLGLQEYILRYAAITYGKNVEFEMLEKNIALLISPYTEGGMKLEDGKEVKIFLGSLKNLVSGAGGFFDCFTPTIREIHSAYRAAVSNNVLSDFGKLPERYIVSNILSSIHVSFMDAVLAKLKNLVPDEAEFAKKAKSIMSYYADTEHERWYNERYIQGYRHDKSHEPLYLRNKNLVHWDFLSDKQKEENLIYAINSLLAYKKKKEHTNKEKLRIKEYTIK